MSKWIFKDNNSAVCSCCNRNNVLFGNYCKWCGTKMVEEQENEVSKMIVYVNDNQTGFERAKLTDVIDIAKSETGFSILIVKGNKTEVMKFGRDVYLNVYNEKENENVD